MAQLLYRVSLHGGQETETKLTPGTPENFVYLLLFCSLQKRQRGTEYDLRNPKMLSSIGVIVCIATPSLYRTQDTQSSPVHRASMLQTSAG